MTEILLAAVTAAWLGILTSISPCPLATNILAISFVGRQVDSPRRVFLAGLLYTCGRALTYVVIGSILVSSLMSAPSVSHLLQKYMNKVLGPVLILVGMFMLELITFSGKGSEMSGSMQKRVERMGLWGAGLLGIVFALSFCPFSATLFFGSLIPVAVKCGSSVLLPLLYGIGTAVPVIVFAVVVALGATAISRMFDTVKRIEWWARRITGVLFVVVGIYYTLVNIYGLKLYP
jgi:cytochrome c biogenesis protein CcdA